MYPPPSPLGSFVITFACGLFIALFTCANSRSLNIPICDIFDIWYDYQDQSTVTNTFLTSDISQTGDDERDILLPILFISANDENEE